MGGTNVASPLQTIDYQYNIRGWMTKINDPSNLNGKLFGYEMKYTNPVYTSIASGKYNGNIAEIDWKTSNDEVLRRYDYTYDPLNRLLKGTYSEPNSSVPQNNLYNEETNYDINGNITRLWRNTSNAGSELLIDNLTYNYSGNKLLSVTDAAQNVSGYVGGGNTITYDDNGNMTKHSDKGISSILYNYLNLPNAIVNSNMPSFYNTTTHLYRADGVKLKKIYPYKKWGNFGAISYSTKTTDYLDGFQYLLDDSGVMCIGCSAPQPDLKFVPTSEGYYDFAENKYIYNYVDHLGNVRLSYRSNGSGGTEIIEENNYYPFGLKHDGYNELSGNPSYNYKYNGKELQLETGMYDYGARMYMPDIGRWGVIDPLAETSRRWSPYTYAYNNPIRFIDPDGMENKDIILAGKQSAIDKAKNLMNEGLGGDYVSVKNGKVEINMSADQIAGLNKEQKAFYNTLNEAIESDNKNIFSLSESDISVPLATRSKEGGFVKMDIDDVNSFGKETGPYSRFSIFGHEIAEQDAYLSGHADYMNDEKTGHHDIAIKEAENKINGGWERGSSIITNQVIERETVKTDGFLRTFPVFNRTVTTSFSKNGKVVNASYEIKKGNVVKK